MIHSILKNAKHADVHLKPFPHLVLDNALDGELYHELENEYPFEYRIDGYSGFANNTRYQISAVDGLRGTRLSPLWQEFVRYHTSEKFLEDVFTVFETALSAYYPKLSLPMHTGIRFKDKTADVWMDCQPGINSPVKKVSSVKGPHLDHQNELFASLLYFRHHEDTSEGGELELYRATRNPSFYGQRLVKEKYVEKVSSVSYAPNRLIFFLNTIDSIHGVSPRGETPYTRRLTNIIGEVDGDPLFHIPLAESLYSKVRHHLGLTVSR